MSSIIRSVRSHVHGIDGLRAVAAFAVVAHHVGFDTGATFVSPLGPVLARLDIGVPIFFVISGFLLGGPFVVRLLDDRPVDGIGRFWFRRVVRVYPAYWVVFTIMVLFLGTTVASFYQGVMFFGLLQIYDPDIALRGMSQAWTLCTEISFYAMVPLLALAVRPLFSRARAASRTTMLLVGCALLYGAGVAWRLAMVAFDPPFARVSFLWLTGQIDYFALGLALAVVAARVRTDPAWSARASRAVALPSLWFLGALAAFALVCSLGLTRTIVAQDSPLVFGHGGEFLRQFLYGLVALLLLVPLVLSTSPRGSARVVFSTRGMAFLGVLSYGVYLWHKALIPKVQSWFGWQEFQGNFWVVFVIVCVLSTALAWVTYHLVEVPALRLSKGGSLRVAITEPAANAESDSPRT